MEDQWTDDDRDIRNFFGLMASVCWGAVIVTILTVPKYNVTILAVVGAFGLVFTAAFFGWRIIKPRLADTQYLSLARFASDTRIYLVVVFFLVVWLVESGLLERYRETRDFWKHVPVAHGVTNRELPAQ